MVLTVPAPGVNLTVVVPVLQDDEALHGLLNLMNQYQLQAVVVDGAGSESTAALVTAPHVYLRHPASRGAQIAAGIAVAAGDWIWVLHADTRPDPRAIADINDLVRGGRPCWGRFDVALDGLSLIAWFMNKRSKLTKICTGDQGMYFHRSLLDVSGGFPQQPLMEDIEVSKRLKRNSASVFRIPEGRITAATRRWHSNGIIRTVLSMWWFRIRYFFGADPGDLGRDYYGNQSGQ